LCATRLAGARSRKATVGRVDVRVLHGDMPQAARARTIASLRDASERADPQQQKQQPPSQRRGGELPSEAGRQRVLVATDVAARGLDLPGVDLVLQVGSRDDVSRKDCCLRSQRGVTAVAPHLVCFSSACRGCAARKGRSTPRSVAVRRRSFGRLE